MITAAHIVRLAQSPEGMDNMALTMRTSITQSQVWDTIQGKYPTGKQWDDLEELYSEVLGTRLHHRQVRMIMDLHPKAALYLARGSVGDTDVNDMLMDALSQFVLGCDWPINGDELGETRMEIFLATLRHQFNRLKF